VVVADSRSPRDGKFIEIIGTYDPKKPDHNSTLQLDRIEHWISKGAQPSDTVRSLIKKNKKQPDQATPDAATTAPPESAAPVAAAVEPSVDLETPAPTTSAEETAAVSESAAPTSVAEESIAVAEESKAAEDSPSNTPPSPS
jgi:small subunit ribosomal protein S16